MILGYYLRKFYFLILFPQENKRRRKEKGSNGGRGTGPTGCCMAGLPLPYAGHRMAGFLPPLGTR